MSLLTILQKIGIIEALITRKDLKRLHELIESAYDAGLISKNVFRELMLELSDIAALEGEELIKRAREFEKKIKRILNV